jgi:pimeloyl-ACP methyl ester carboxylesterase
MNQPLRRNLFAGSVALVVSLSLLLASCKKAEELAAPTLQSKATSAAAVSEESLIPTTEDLQTPVAAESTSVPPAFEPRFDEDECQFDIPEGVDVRCGFLTVPEKYSESDNQRTLRLHAAIFESDHPNPAPDPIVYLAGGPGLNLLESAPLNFEQTFAPLMAERDLILFDQRGTGFSEPSLACPELVDSLYEMLDDQLSSDEIAEQNSKALFECRDRLVKDGVDLSAYNSGESASDVNALREALGYDKWNLYGTSYGTRLAQTVMRDHPKGIRAVVLDSVYPIAANMLTEMPGNVSRSMEWFFSTCTDDAACSEAYPNFEDTFFKMIDELNAEPVVVEVPNVFTGARHEVLVGGDALLSLFFQSLYHPELSSLFPKMATDMQMGDYGLLTGYIANWLVKLDFVSHGMQISVQCHEEAAFTNTDEVSEALAVYPDLEDFFNQSISSGDLGLSICEQWGAGEAEPFENLAIESELPTLIIAGEHDPVTPPSWGRDVAFGLSNHRFFEFPGVGHGPSLSHDCARSVALSFLNNPEAEPDGSCIADMSFSFVTPVTSGDIVLESVEIESFDISAMSPEGWIRADDEYFVSPDREFELVIKEDREQSVETFRERWGATELREELDSNGLNWSISTISLDDPSVAGFIATAPSDEGFYLVLLITSQDGPEMIYESIFFPIVSAFKTTADSS